MGITQTLIQCMYVEIFRYWHAILQAASSFGMKHLNENKM